MVVIHLRKDGPIHVTGHAELRDSEGNLLESGEEMWLCRCGYSAKKPFCDGSHKRVGFSDESQQV